MNDRKDRQKDQPTYGVSKGFSLGLIEVEEPIRRHLQGEATRGGWKLRLIAGRVDPEPSWH